jgi:phage terminase large subunit GpA-like protein
MKNDSIDSYLLDFLKPEKRLFVDEWADEFRILSQKASAEPGRYRTSRTPYLRQIMRDLSVLSPVQEVIFKKGAQIGATEVGNNWIGYIIDHSPAPVMMVQPNIDMAKRNSKTRIEPLIEECPQLLEKVKEKKSRDSSNTTLAKDFPGGVLLIAGANSGAGLRSAPIRFLFLDEVDAYKTDVDGEGSPIKLAKARTRTFNKKKIFQASTPTTKEQSVIHAEFETTDQRYYYVPCPHCKEKQKLVWSQIKWEGKDPLTAYYECEHCEKPIKNYQKSWMLERGEWVSEKPENANPRRTGYHLNALYSPHGWYSWEEAVEEYLEAEEQPDRMKTFVNTVLGEVWSAKTEKPDWRRIYERREQYRRNMVPEDVVFLTMGVDVQRDRLELEIVGWCERKVSYSIDYRVLPGDTNEDEVWNKLEEVIFESFPAVSNPKLEMQVKMVCIDSGYETNTVYNFVRRFSSSRVLAVKGRDSQNVAVAAPTKTDVTVRGKRIKAGVNVWNVGVSVLKEELYGWLRKPKPLESEEEPYGFCHFPQYGEGYFKGLTAEELATVKDRKGNLKTEWHKTRERNEPIDCRVYARAAAHLLGMDRARKEQWTVWRSERYNVLPEARKEKLQEATPAKRKKRKSDWL